MKVIIGIMLSTLFHVALGWQWSIVAGAIVGWWAIRHGWLYGAVCVGASWAIMTAYNYLVAPEQIDRFTTTMSGFVEGAPEWTIPFATIVIGIVLGAAGGFLGQTLVPLINRSSARNR